MTDVPEAEDIPGTLIIRIRESLDFGTWRSYDGLTLTYIISANSSQLKGVHRHPTVLRP